MAFQPTPADVSVIISTATSAPASTEPTLATERRITPSWTVSQVKGKLETMSGIPPGSQRLLFKSPGRPDQWIEGDERLIGEWGLARGCEIEVGLWSSFEVYIYIHPYTQDDLFTDYVVCGRFMIHARLQHDPISQICRPSRNTSYPRRNTNRCPIRCLHGKRRRNWEDLIQMRNLQRIYYMNRWSRMQLRLRREVRTFPFP